MHELTTQHVRCPQMDELLGSLDQFGHGLHSGDSGDMDVTVNQSSARVRLLISYRITSSQPSCPTYGQRYFPDRSIEIGEEFPGASRMVTVSVPLGFTDLMSPSSAITSCKPSRRHERAGSITCAFLRINFGGFSRTQGFSASFDRLPMRQGMRSANGRYSGKTHAYPCMRLSSLVRASIMASA